MSFQLRLPRLFSELLANNPLESAVKVSMNRVSDFIGDPTRSLCFFPEYTGHGVDHFQRVLDASAALVRPDFVDQMTAEDAAVLAVAVSLHDVAMHLTREGLQTLLVAERYRQVVAGFDMQPWHVLWDEYLAEVMHWGKKQIVKIVGEPISDDLDSMTSMAEQLRHTNRFDELPWTPGYFKVAGEFIRRHHGRMAHEFALVGLPGRLDTDSISLFDPDWRLRDLCGVVARSHTIGLRDTMGYLQHQYHGRVACHRCHPIFLMAVLRIADYLDVEAERAPAMSLKVRSLQSPFSNREWAVHQSITDVRPDENDNEAIFVVASPVDVHTFLQVQKLLTAVQRELDISWAVLGEVFGKQDDLRTAGIRLRRIRSNLDDEAKMRASVSYIPRQFAFRSAGHALLTRLVGPLYNDAVEVGIRELLQNAIDAVNEREFLMRGAGQRPTAEPLEVRILVDKTADSEFCVTVEDDGIGMDEHILADYFLTVGASFRESDAWKRSFVKAGTPQVIRSGRFGVGVLAAFLLGDRIEVTTRHVQAPPDGAIHFNASIYDELIELTKARRDAVGTTIRVCLDEATYSKLTAHNGLEWDWFRWQSPRIRRSINGEEALPKLVPIPSPELELPYEWHRIHVDGYDDIAWSYGRAPNLVCNGITIGSSASSYGYSVQLHWEGDRGPLDPSVPVTVPSVAVVDRAGRFPINLQRFALVGGKYPFAKELLRDVAIDHCAFCFVYGPTSDPMSAPLPRELVP
jgi:molecular chaperone HtpG